MLKIGILTSGGDCQALNAAMRGVVKCLHEYDNDLKVYGFKDGYKGLINGDYHMMSINEFSGILNQGGTILGTSRMPYKFIEEPDENGKEKIPSMVRTYKKLELDCLVMLGGNGSHKTARDLMLNGLNVVTLPKTIDNDLCETEVSFGFQSAVDIATNAIDCIHTTAASHSRVFIIELMGHKTGWLTMNAGIAGGADVILIPEIPYNIDAIVDTIKKRTDSGKHFTIIAVAEGVMSSDEAKLTKKEFKISRKAEKYPSVAYKIGAQIMEATGQEVRVTVPGHVQRGGQPDPYDRVIATRLGCKAAQLIINKDYGYMLCVKNNKIDKVPISDVAGKTKFISPDADIIKEAKALGICLGER